MTDLVWDKATASLLMQLDKDSFDVLHSRYIDFRTTLHDTNMEPVKVHSSLSKKALEELQLIREVSQYLQKKKDDDINKAKADAEAEEAENSKDSKEEENTKEVSDSQETTESQQNTN